MPYMDKLNTIINGLISPQAQENDEKAQFPKTAVNALGEAGLFGLISSKEVGGLGCGLAEAAGVVEKIAMACPSTAMILTMHYSATAVIEKFGTNEVRKQIAMGQSLATLAWSEAGSRSHFWAPTGTAQKNNDGSISLNNFKTMVTSAYEADLYVWTSKPFAAEGPSTMWLVEKNNPALMEGKNKLNKNFNGFGLRANASAPMKVENMKVTEKDLLGVDGGSFDTMISVVLPIFCTLNAACSVGIMTSAISETIKHVTISKHDHLSQTIAELPTVRSYLAQAQIKKDLISTLKNDTITALNDNRADAMLRVMEVKAAASEAALEVTDICMRVAAGTAFRKDLNIERFFRDARASHIMAPTSDVLYDFIGKAICGMPVFG